MKPARARIDFHPTFVSWRAPHCAYAFVTLKSWRKQRPVFEQKANPVFVTAEKHFIFSPVVVGHGSQGIMGELSF